MPTQRRWRRSARNCCPVARPPGCPRTWPRARAALRLMRNWPRSPPCSPCHRAADAGRTHRADRGRAGHRGRGPGHGRSPGRGRSPARRCGGRGRRCHTGHARAWRLAGPGRAGPHQGAAGRRAGWRGHDRSWLALRVAAVTAAVAVIAGGGYGVAQLLTGSPAVNGAASRAAPGGAAPNIRVTGPVPRMSAGGFIRRQARPAAALRTFALLVISSGTNYQPRNPGRPGQHRPRRS